MGTPCYFSLVRVSLRIICQSVSVYGQFCGSLGIPFHTKFYLKIFLFGAYPHLKILLFTSCKRCLNALFPDFHVSETNSLREYGNWQRLVKRRKLFCESLA